MGCDYRYGETSPVVAAVDAATAIDAGDLVYQDSGKILPASAASLWNTSTAGTQEDFKDAFLGVSGQRSRAGDAYDVRVNTTGVFEFDCDPAQFELGDLVGPAKGGGDHLLPQKVIAVAGAQLAVGRVVKRYPANTTRVLVEVLSSVIKGGVQNVY